VFRLSSIKKNAGEILRIRPVSSKLLDSLLAEYDNERVRDSASGLPKGEESSSWEIFKMVQKLPFLIAAEIYWLARSQKQGSVFKN
jgi:hypothetical protein